MPTTVNRETLQSSLERYFGQIPDPRVERTRAHQLLDIIAIALFAVPWCMRAYPDGHQEFLYGGACNL